MNSGARDRVTLRAGARTGLARVALAALCLGLSPATLAQEFPSRPVRWVIPFGPGTIFETAARLLIPGMSAGFGQPVVIENRPGAGALIGTEYVARQVTADGHTMLMGLANLLTFKAAALYDAGRDCGAEANAAKYLGAEAGFTACEASVLAHGGMGYAKEYFVERYFREAMIARIAPVSREMILNFIAERVLGLPKSY